MRLLYLKVNLTLYKRTIKRGGARKRSSFLKPTVCIFVNSVFYVKLQQPLFLYAISRLNNLVGTNSLRHCQSFGREDHNTTRQSSIPIINTHTSIKWCVNPYSKHWGGNLNCKFIQKLKPRVTSVKFESKMKKWSGMEHSGKCHSHFYCGANRIFHARIFFLGTQKRGNLSMMQRIQSIEVAFTEMRTLYLKMPTFQIWYCDTLLWIVAFQEELVFFVIVILLLELVPLSFQSGGIGTHYVTFFFRF